MWEFQTYLSFPQSPADYLEKRIFIFPSLLLHRYITLYIKSFDLKHVLPVSSISPEALI